MLEKAWAKLHGCYQHIESGLSYQALRDLTGAHSYLIKIPEMDPEELWAKIKDADDRDFVMSIASQPDWEVERLALKKKGVTTFHAYSLIDVFEVALADGR